MSVKELRLASGMARKEFAEYFGINYRTIQKWELHGSSPEGRKCPEYLLDLMKYKLKREGFIKDAMDEEILNILKEAQIKWEKKHCEQIENEGLLSEAALVEKIKAMKHVMTYASEYISIYEDVAHGEQYLITTDDNDKIYYICKVLN